MPNFLLFVKFLPKPLCQKIMKRWSMIRIGFERSPIFHYTLKEPPLEDNTKTRKPKRAILEAVSKHTNGGLI